MQRGVFYTVFSISGWGTGAKKVKVSLKKNWTSKPVLMRGSSIPANCLSLSLINRKNTIYERGNDARDDSLRGGRRSRHLLPLLDGDRARRLRLARRARLLRPKIQRFVEPEIALLPRAWPRFSLREELPAALDDGLAREPQRRQRCQGADHRWRCATAAAARRRQRASVRNEGLGRRYPQQCEFHGFCVAGPSCADAGDTRRGRSRHSTLTYARA